MCSMAKQEITQSRTKQKLQPTIKRNKFVNSIRSYTVILDYTGIYNYISPCAEHALCFKDV